MPSPSPLLCPSSFLACAARTRLALSSVPGSLALQTGKWGKREAPHEVGGIEKVEKLHCSSKAVSFIK